MPKNDDFRLAHVVVASAVDVSEVRGRLSDIMSQRWGGDFAAQYRNR